MRNGDLYRIQGMAKSGVSDSEIVRHFRNRYDEAEVLRFIPAKAKPKEEKPEPEVEPEPEPEAKAASLAKRRARAVHHTKK